MSKISKFCASIIVLLEGVQIKTLQKELFADNDLETQNLLVNWQ